MPIKCNNCGWTNPDGSCYCEKCNSPLPMAGSQPAYNPRATMADVNPRATMADVNPRATMADVNPRATMADVNPRATMADVNPRATMADVNPRATVADFNPRATMCEAPMASAKSYRLLCIDDRMGNVINLQSEVPLSLVDGEIILIGGLRYKVLI